MEVLELKPINNKKITIYLIDKNKINTKLNDIDILQALIKDNNVSFISVEINNGNFKKFKNSNLSIVLNSINLDYYLLDIPEYAYGYLFEEISRKEDQIKELLREYRIMDNKDSLKGLNLKSWIDVLIKEVFQEKNLLETKIRPQWIVKKILDLIKSHKDEKLSLIHFYHEKSLIELIKLFGELHIEAIMYDLNNVYNIPYLIIKQEENN